MDRSPLHSARFALARKFVFATSYRPSLFAVAWAEHCCHSQSSTSWGSFSAHEIGQVLPSFLTLSKLDGMTKPAGPRRPESNVLS
jgi:hypothetical protein